MNDRRDATRTTAVQTALQAAPCSLRALARAAGIDHADLVRVRAGDRPATVALARAVMGALARWGDDCRDAARGIRHTLAKGDR